MKKKGARSLCYCYCCSAFSTCLFLLSWWQKNGFGAFKKFEEDVAPFLLVFSSCHSDNKTDLELSRSLKEDEMNNRSKGDISLLSFQRRIEGRGVKLCCHICCWQHLIPILSFQLLVGLLKTFIIFLHLLYSKFSIMLYLNASNREGIMYDLKRQETIGAYILFFG